MTITVRKLGTTEYLAALTQMRAFISDRAAQPAGSGDELWLTEHPPVFTMGFASRREHLRRPGDIAVVETERGGQVTYHGPGQIVAYLLLDLRRRKLGVRELVCRLESAVMECLAGCGIVAIRMEGAPGIFVARHQVQNHERDGAQDTRLRQARETCGVAAPAGLRLAKIASIGLKVTRGFTWHGLALNGRMDLEPFSRIDPCGYPGLEVTDVATEAADGLQSGLALLADRLAQALVTSIEG